MFRYRKKLRGKELSPDEIFLDSQNLPGFDQSQMEGRFEMLLSRTVAIVLFVSFVGAALIASVQLWNLQVRRGEELRARALANRMESHSILPERGIITDMNGIELAWNEPRFRVIINSSILSDFEDEIRIFLSSIESSYSFEDLREKFGDRSSDIVMIDKLSWIEAQSFIVTFLDIPFRIESSSLRTYTDARGLSHLLGYTAYPSEEERLFFLSDVKIGKTGIEKYFDKALRGQKGVRLVELNAEGDVVSESIQEDAKDGSSITLTVDMELQSKLYSILAGVADTRDFAGGGAAVLLDIDTGALRATVSIPEFDSGIFTAGLSEEEFALLLTDPRAPFFFRALEGRYAPGSIFKPVIALAALNEGIISEDKELFSSGSISLPHPYEEDKFSVFYDWKAHGWVDMRRALAVSSNVYFYSVGGGYEEQEGVGAEMIHEYARRFGFGTPVFEDIHDASGNVPHPDDLEFWRVGDTYNLSIGQGGLEVTPLQMARFIAMLARDGEVPSIHFIEEPEALNKEIENSSLADVNIPQEYYNVVKEGLRLAVQGGTAQAVSGLGVSVAGKTGTAEIGGGKVNSWFIGFLPYDNPQLALAIVLERGNENNLVGAASAAREFIQWLVTARPDYIQK